MNHDIDVTNGFNSEMGGKRRVEGAEHVNGRADDGGQGERDGRNSPIYLPFRSFTVCFGKLVRLRDSAGAVSSCRGKCGTDQFEVEVLFVSASVEGFGSFDRC